MKRIDNLYSRIYDIDNLRAADTIARRGKKNQRAIRKHDLNREANLQQVQQALLHKTFRTSLYTTFTIREPKERLIFRLPYYPDRIVQHAIMNVLEPIFMRFFTTDTYSCIKGKGIHAAANAIKTALKDVVGTTYCLKFDITKFYPSVDHDILKTQLRRKFKDKDLLWLLDDIIDSAPGLPIGNYLSQFLANFNLSGFDHWIKERKAVKYYFRYADDIVILANNKQYLHQLLTEIKEYFGTNLKLSIKGNYQVFPVQKRGIDFVGYVFYHTHIRLRKTIKQNFARMMRRRRKKQSIAAYYGWAKHANSRHLLKKLLKRNPATTGIINMKYTLTLETDSAEELATVASAFNGLGFKTAAGTKVKKATADNTSKPDENTGDKPITQEAVRLAAQGLITAGKKPELKKLLTKYGSDSISNLDKEHFEAFIDDIKSL